MKTNGTKSETATPDAKEHLPAPPADDLDQLMREDAGKGVTTRIEDLAFWHPDIDNNTDWYRALQAYHERDDVQPLVTVLQSDKPPTARILFLLGDLLKLRANRPHRGPLPTPALERTPDMAKLEYALLWVREAVKGGVAVKDAVAREAAANKLSVETLNKAYHGQHGGLRRARGERDPKKLKWPASPSRR